MEMPKLVTKESDGKIEATTTLVTVDLDDDKIPSLEIFIGARADKAEGVDEALQKIVKINLPDWIKNMLTNAVKAG